MILDNTEQFHFKTEEIKEDLENDLKALITQMLDSQGLLFRTKRKKRNGPIYNLPAYIIELKHSKEWFKLEKTFKKSIAELAYILMIDITNENKLLPAIKEHCKEQVELFAEGYAKGWFREPEEIQKIKDDMKALKLKKEIVKKSGIRSSNLIVSVL